jgi:hypothetical protein
LAGIEPTPARSGRAGYARLNLSATAGMAHLTLTAVVDGLQELVKVILVKLTFVINLLSLIDLLFGFSRLIF